MDRILKSVRSRRRGLQLRPRDELMKELEARTKELEGLPPGSFPPYVLEAAKEAAKDLRESDTEEELTHRVAGWVRDSMEDKDKARRNLRAQLGSFILMADVGDGQSEPGRHGWRPVPNNDLNLICGKCGIVGFKPSWDPKGQIRAPYRCDQFVKLIAETQ